MSNRNALEAEERRRLASVFLARTLERIEQIRRLVPQLVAKDSLAWSELRLFAEITMRESRALDLGLLQSCAAELSGLMAEEDSSLADPAHLFHVTSAIELIGIEVTTRLIEYTSPGKRS